MRQAQDLAPFDTPRVRSQSTPRTIIALLLAFAAFVAFMSASQWGAPPADACSLASERVPMAPAVAQAVGTPQPQRANAAAALQTQKTLTPFADSWIDQLNASANHGGDYQLSVGWASSNMSGAQRALLRFMLAEEVPPDAIIDSAFLKLWLASASGPASVSMHVLLATSTWEEYGVNWNNRPGSGAPTASTAVGTAQQYYAWNVTALVQAWLAGANYGLEVRGPEAELGVAHARSFGSHEDVELPPLLEITYHLPLPGTPTRTPTARPTETATPGGTVDVVPDMDSWVNQARPDDNHGADAELAVGKTTRFSQGYTMATLLHWSFVGLPEHACINRAELKLYLQGATGPDDYAIALGALTAQWQEMSVTWANLPPAVDTGLRPWALPSTTGWHTLDITELVCAWASGAARNYGMLLSPSASADGTRTFSSRQGEHPAILTLGYYLESDPPTNPTHFGSDHTPSTWSNNPVVSVEWSGATDAGGCGVYGYSYTWNRSDKSPPPDIVVDTTAPTATTRLDDGTWWLFMRSRDVAGNWAAGAAQFGPIWIDTTPPSNPTVLSSNTHLPGAWSAIPQVGMTWSGANDGVGCGVAGYSIEWSTSEDTIPDATVDAFTEANTSAPLADGASHYFHLRACDGLGNCSALLHSGPYAVDGHAPTSSAMGGHGETFTSASTEFMLYWSGTDGNGIGILNYDVQYRNVSEDGPWVDWLLATTDTSAQMTGVAGRLYALRCRARDRIWREENWPAEPDGYVLVESGDLALYTRGIEVTQAIQNLYNNVPIIAGKRTFVRVYAHCTSGDPTYPNVAALLRVFRDGALLGTLPPGNPGGRATVKAAPNRAVLDDSFWFEVPVDWVRAGSVMEFEAEVNPAPRRYGERNYANNVARVGLVPGSTPPMNLVIYSIPYYDQGHLINILSGDVSQLESLLRRMYPIGTLNLSLREMPTPYDTPPENGQALDDLTVLWFHDLVFHAENVSTRYYGMLRSATRTGLAWTQWGVGMGRTGPVLPTDPASSAPWGARIGAHELGHTYGRPHTQGCGEPPKFDSNYPYENGDINNNNSQDYNNYYLGLDAQGPRVYPPTWKDIMTYCGDQWISDYTSGWIRYTMLKEAGLISGGAEGPSLVAQEQLVVLARVVSPTLALTWQMVARVPDAVGSVEDTPGEYVVQLQDARGGVLSSRGYALKYDETGTTGSLMAVLPWVTNTQRVAVLYVPEDISQMGRVLGTRLVSAHAPTVTLLYPSGGETLTGESVAVGWLGGDLDGGAPTYALSYSANDGATWHTVSINLTGTQTMLNLAALPGGSACRLRIRANDGVNTSSDTSGAFDVPDKVPTVKISSPPDGARRAYGQLVTCEGSALDHEDGFLAGTSLRWISSLAGPLGVGQLLQLTNLITGVHTITLEAVDSASHVVTSTTTLMIGQPVAPLWLPLVRRG